MTIWVAKIKLDTEEEVIRTFSGIGEETHTAWLEIEAMCGRWGHKLLHLEKDDEDPP